MTARRGATDLAGILPIDKPAGMTSHDVVDVLRRATGERRIGHAGTLDPLATGLLLVLVGRATRLERYLVGHDKRYEARIIFGTTTDTLDAEGRVIAEQDVPEALWDPKTAQAVLRSLLGQSEQMPPAYSAIKKDGVPSYRLARAGGEPDLAPRPIEVSEATIVSVDYGSRSWNAVFTVSSGTYIRSLARDVGLAGGTVAHLGGLRRTRIGTFDVADAYNLDEVALVAGEGVLDPLFADPVPALGFPVVEVDFAETRDGRAVPCRATDLRQGERVALVGQGALLGVYLRQGDMLKAETVLVPGVSR